MPKKQNLAMLEAPPEPKSIAYVGPPYKTLPPIGSAPPTGRQRQPTTPRKLSTAPGATEKTPRDERPPFDRTYSMPPEFPESVQYQSGHTTRQTVKTDGEATVGESVGTADGRHQPHADEQLHADDRFFMTQVRHLFFFLLFLFLQDPTKDREAEFILEYIENFFEVGTCMGCEISTIITHPLIFD